MCAYEQYHITGLTVKNWNEAIALARQHPGWYYHSRDNQFDAAGAYINFLHTVLGQDTLGVPTAIEFVACGEHHFAIAYGCCLPVDYPGNDNICDWIRVQSEITTSSVESLGALAWLNGIVMLSNHCVVDFTTPIGHMRQAFHEAMPVTLCEHISGTEIPILAPYISIHFTLSAQIFAHRTLTIEYMLNSWKWWRHEHSHPKRISNSLRFYLPLLPRARIKFKAYNDTTFILRLEWTRNTVQ